MDELNNKVQMINSTVYTPGNMRTLRKKPDRLRGTFSFIEWGESTNGYCLVGHNDSLVVILQGIIHVSRKNEPTRLHIETIQASINIPFIVYAQHILNRQEKDIKISFDTDIAIAAANNKEYFTFPTFQGIERISISPEGDWSKLHDSTHFGCDCQVCSSTPAVVLIKNTDPSLLSYHNFYVLEDFKIIFDGLSSMNIPSHDMVIEAQPKYVTKGAKNDELRIAEAEAKKNPKGGKIKRPPKAPIVNRPQLIGHDAPDLASVQHNDIFASLPQYIKHNFNLMRKVFKTDAENPYWLLDTQIQLPETIKKEGQKRSKTLEGLL